MDKEIQARTHHHILLASLSSSIISTTLTNPIEVAKLKTQFAPISCPKYPHPSAQIIRCDCIKFSYRDSFKGLSIVIPQVVIANAIFMQLYERQRSIYLNYMGSAPATAISSVISRLFVSTLLNPLEAHRVRKINSTANNKIVSKERALKVTLVRDLLFSMMYWSTIETFRNYYTGAEYRGSRQVGSIDANAFAGIFGGGFVAAFTTPLDTLKTRIQSGIKIEGSIFKQINSIYQRQGLAGLYAGIHFRAMKSGLHSATYLIFYEKILSSFQNSQKIDIQQ